MISHRSRDGVSSLLQDIESMLPALPRLPLLNLARGILLAILLMVPWPFGSVLAQTYQWFYPLLLITLLATLLADKATSARARSLALFYAVVLMPLFWGGFQLIPLSPSLQQAVSPQANIWRVDLGAFDQNETDAPRGETAWDPLSVFPVATQRACALLLLAVAMLVLSSHLFHQSASQQLLYGVILASGCVVAIFGIVHKLTSSDLIFWQYTSSPNATPFGPFVHRNNAAGYLNLALAAGVYLIAQRLAEIQRRAASQEGVGVPSDHAPTDETRTVTWWSYVDARLHGLIGAVALVVGGVAASASRGGILSLTVGVVLLSFLGLWNRRFRLLGIAMLLLTGLGWGGLLWLNLEQPTVVRLRTLIESDELARNVRIDNWRVGLRAAQDFPLTGSGYGTYRYAYLPYEEVAARDWFLHAENVLVETFLEGGALGLVLLFLGIGYLGYHAFRLAWSRHDPSAMAAGLATLFLLATQLPHSCLDLGIYLPANLLTMAALAGTAIGYRLRHPSASDAPGVSTVELHEGLSQGRGWRWWMQRRNSTPSTSVASRAWSEKAAPVWRACGLMLGAGLLASWWIAAGAAVAEPRKFVRPGDLAPGVEAPERFARRIAHWQQVVRRIPGDAEAHRHLATAWVGHYQATARKELIDHGVPPDEATQLTSLAAVEAQAMRLALSEQDVRLAQLRQHPYVVANLLPAKRHLELARRHCPLIGSVHLLLARLTFVTDDPRRNEVDLRRFESTAPRTAETLLTAGLMHLAAERADVAWPLLREVWRQDPSRAGAVLTTVQPPIPFEQLVTAIIPQDPEEYVRAAREYFAGKENAPFRRRLLKLAGETVALGPHEELPPVTHVPTSEALRDYVQAAIWWEEGEQLRAITAMERALRAEPDRAEWHYLFARWRLARREYADALPAARRAVALQANNPRYRALLRHITERLRQS